MLSVGFKKTTVIIIENKFKTATKNYNDVKRDL